ncbi:hypothetical protein GUITHDRAFT_154242 [Guillardia theta CCMP2712]|uniref:Uncharacterized protein n=1 Tax=Guillardia theta (strain CCMP2712) TaxID=905079 RepID=L1IVG7_GUITC|nr:hypothetical protein GUITHDRAFT_154242 [Guillardia theta CCMP2712]EKX40107.1 hypothetical protein GUITHDRAFT_154242 [Guillardia theta CCMP2712]|eukprot:XP_005827087.1 hypothetical protein GUITHDRAFT_154242 [Guillardia theta CCMP2712]
MWNEFSSRLEAPVSNRPDFSESPSAGKSYPLDHDRPRDTNDTLTPSQRRLVSKYSENTTPSDQKGGNHYPLRKPPKATIPRDLIRDLHAKTASLQQQLRTATDQVRLLHTENESLLQSASYEQALKYLDTVSPYSAVADLSLQSHVLNYPYPLSPRSPKVLAGTPSNDESAIRPMQGARSTFTCI